MSRAHGAVKSDLAQALERSAVLEQHIVTQVAAAHQFRAESEVSRNTIDELERTTSQDRLAIDAASMQIDKLGELLGAADMSAADTLVAAEAQAYSMPCASSAAAHDARSPAPFAQRGT